MKKAFSLVEILIASVLLSVTMLALFKTKNNNIFLVEKYQEMKKQNDYINLSMDTKGYSKRNNNIHLDDYFNIDDDEIRRDFKKIKIKIKDQALGTQALKLPYNFIFLSIYNFKTTYSFENGISKDLYRFKLELSLNN